MNFPSNIQKSLTYISDYCDKHSCEECICYVSEKKTCMFEISPAYWKELLKDKK